MRKIGIVRIDNNRRTIQKKSYIKRIARNYVLYLFLIPAVTYVWIFHYMPIYGVLIAFKDYKASLGILGSPWIGLDNFERFLNSPFFGEILSNTIILSIYHLIAGFPIPIILALMLNYCKNARFKRFVQNVTYAPHFISMVVLVGMIMILLSPRTGAVNALITALGGEPVFFVAKPELFRHLYVWSGVWQNMGWSSIIYMAVLANVSPELHEAAIVDGAGKLCRIRHIDIPSILPTIIILLILSVGNLMSVGFDKVFLMQNQLNIKTSEIIATYIYKQGLLNVDYGYASAVGLFNNIINLILLVSVNKLSRKLSDNSLW